MAKDRRQPTNGPYMNQMSNPTASIMIPINGTFMCCTEHLSREIRAAALCNECMQVFLPVSELVYHKAINNGVAHGERAN